MNRIHGIKDHFIIIGMLTHFGDAKLQYEYIQANEYIYYMPSKNAGGCKYQHVAVAHDNHINKPLMIELC